MKNSKDTGKFRYTFPLVAALACLCAPHAAHALHVPLDRVILGGDKTEAYITIVNDTKVPQGYRLGWMHYVMKEDRLGLVSLPMDQELPGVHWADKLVSFEKDRVVLPPGKSTKVRVFLKNKPAEGAREYRAHLWIWEEEDASRATPGMQASAKAGISMPLFVRTGNLAATASLSDIAASWLPEVGKLRAAFTLSREGNRSLYGDLEFACGGVVVHRMPGISVYTEVARRYLSVDFNVPPSARVACSYGMQLRYRARDADGAFRRAILAEVETHVTGGGG